MTWLTEHSLSIAVIGGAAVVLLAIGYMASRNARFLFAAAAISVAAIGLILAERLIVTEAEQVEGAVWHLADANEAGDLQRVIDGISPSTARAMTNPTSRLTAELPSVADAAHHAEPQPAFAPSSIPDYDADALRQRGIRELTGDHLVLYTDLPAERVRDAPALVDRLYRALVERYGEPAREHAHGTWRILGHVMGDQHRFRELGLLPAGLPRFAAGLSRGNVFWTLDQETDYYRNHLVLHEAVHCFMDSALGGRGPAWFAEGNAELLATHRRSDGDVRFGAMPQTKQEVERLGRIEMVQQAVAEGRARTVDDVLALPYAVFDHDNTAYAWSWALCALLDGHPRYRQRFRRLHDQVLQPNFNQHVRRVYSEDWNELREEFQLFAANLAYGYDLERCVVDFRAGRPLEAGRQLEVAVASDRGWCNSGVWLEAGGRYRLTPEGRFSIADEPRVWHSEAGGLSYRYVQHRPIGRLLACIRSQGAERQGGPSDMLDVLDVGLGTTLAPEKSGTLYLRINDDWGQLADNRGELRVRVESQRGE
jgi:hypothetical protein